MREDQFTGLSFIILYSRFYWSRSTKDPVDPHWFVIVVLPSQVFLPKITLGITGLHESLDRDYGIEELYWGLS